VTQLAKGSRISRQAISKHLQVLERAALVRCTHLGRETVWQLEPSGLNEARRLFELISRQWDDAVDRLRKFVETPDLR
jgi:DNA-binding transcriptional ArsR family regulator